MFDDDRHLQGLVNNIRVTTRLFDLNNEQCYKIAIFRIASCQSYLFIPSRKLWPQPLMLQISMQTHLNHIENSTEKMNNVTWRL